MGQVEWYGGTHSTTSNCAYICCIWETQVLHYKISLTLTIPSSFFLFPFMCFFHFFAHSCQYLEQFVTSVCILKMALFSHLCSFHSKFDVCLFLLIVIWNILMSVSKGFSVITQSVLLEQMCSQCFQRCIELPSERVLPFWKELYAVTEDITASKWITSQSLRGIHLQGILEDRRRY